MIFTGVVVLYALLCGVASRQFEIPRVNAIVDNVLQEYEEYVDYNGNVSHHRAITKRQATPYWYEEIAHQGISAFGPSGYVVYRNVKDYGARGDGVTDDTAAINAAIHAGGRCGQGCASSTTTPAVVYFPSGTYLISSSIIDQYYTQLVGNPNDPPTLKASPNFSGFGLIDGDKYYTANLNWGSTNVFFRQVRNFVFDLTSVPISSAIAGIHWPTAQSTSLQNIVFQMSAAPGTQHVGMFCESGSAGFMTDLTFNGGRFGAQIGNQQFTMRNLVFNNCVTAISMFWDWGWVFQGISINNCQTGLDISAGGPTGQAVGSVILVDSSISNTPVGVLSAYNPNEAPHTNGSLIIENVALSNVATAVQSSSGSPILAGSTGSLTIPGWGQGSYYTPTGHQRFQGPFTPNRRPSSLLSGNKYYVRSKPQYNPLAVTDFQSVRSAGATGNGVTDDTTALQNAINSATAAGKVVFVDAGTYRVTSTLHIPAGAKIVGESYSVIMSSGSYFADMSNPKPVVQVGNPGQTGQVEWSDMIVSTQGSQPGAVLIEWNLASSGTPSGMWDVHARVGGFAGSNLQVAQCAKNPGSTAVNSACIGAYMTMHITPSASNLYMENMWLWTADHDIDDQSNTQITIYNGRGLLIDSTAGNFWLVGTAVEHHTLYQYQLANTQNVYMGFVQTETPYYQPNPPAPAPFTAVSALNDPNFSSSCAGHSANCNDAWGVRILNSKNVLVYGAGLYSFFNNYDQSCNVINGPENCQENILSLEGSLSSVNIYCLTTIGTTNMITENGESLALYKDNINVFGDTIALFQLAAAGGVSSSTSSTSSKSSTSTQVPPTTLITQTITVTRTTTTATPVTVTTTETPSPTSSPPFWRFMGCYTDQVCARALPHAVGVPGGASNMTIEGCQSTCLGLGYTLAGVEYSDECYCGDTLYNGSGLAPDGNALCDMPCAGNSTQTCGGPNRLDLYQYGSFGVGCGT